MSGLRDDGWYGVVFTRGAQLPCGYHQAAILEISFCKLIWVWVRYNFLREIRIGSRDSGLDVRLDKKLILTRDRMCDVSPAATGGGAFILKPVPSPFVSVSGSVLPITLRRVGSNHGDCGFGIQRNRRIARSGRPSKAMRAAATGALGAAPGHGNARAAEDAFLRAGHGLERVRAGYADFAPIPSDDKLRSMRASIVDHLLPNFPGLRVGCDRW